MRFRNRHTRMLAPILALAAAATVAAGCGGDDDESSEPSSVAIEVSGAKGAPPEVTAPAEADAGPAEITFTNSSDSDTDGQLAFVAEGEDHSDEEVIAELQKAIKSQPVADWFQAVGGAPTTPAGETSTVTQLLEAGTYYVLPSGESGSEVPDTPTKIEVTGESDAELPEADGTVSAVEYSFSGEGLEAGEQKLLLENNGGTWHHFLASPLNPDATIEDAKAFLSSEGEPTGPPPFAGEPGAGPVSSTVIDGGKSQIVDVNLEAGRYAFFCFVADKQTGGPPHVVQGMVSEVEVE